MTPARRLHGALALTAAFLLALSGIAVAGGPERTDERTRGTGVETAVSAQSAEEIAAYWTPERMRAATPPPEAFVEGDPGAEDLGPFTPDGPEQEFAPQPPAGAATATPLFATSEDLSPAWAYSRYEVGTSYTQWPFATNGRVFFTHGQFHTNHSCSGAVVSANNRNTIWTAGHCVHAGGGGPWHYNWQFVPAYRDGSAPFGTFTERQKWSLTGWTQSGTFRYDLGAVQVWPNAGGNVQDRTGGQGLRVNSSRNKYFVNIGYPAASPFNGMRMIVCEAWWAANDSPPGSGPLTMGKGCDMTGGASGGAWHANWGAGGGWIESVNSYKYGHLPQRIYGPYQDNGALNLYNAASQ